MEERGGLLRNASDRARWLVHLALLIVFALTVPCVVISLFKVGLSVPVIFGLLVVVVIVGTFYLYDWKPDPAEAEKGVQESSPSEG